MAREVEVQSSDLGVEQGEALIVLKKMPEYGKIERLDLWEENFHNAVKKNNGENKNLEIVEEIFELGTYNLYGAFAKKGTQVFYNNLVKKLIEQGFSLRNDMDVSCW